MLAVIHTYTHTYTEVQCSQLYNNDIYIIITGSSEVTVYGLCSPVPFAQTGIESRICFRGSPRVT